MALAIDITFQSQNDCHKSARRRQVKLRLRHLKTIFANNRLHLQEGAGMLRYEGGSVCRASQTRRLIWGRLDRVVDVLSDGPGIWYPLVKCGTYVQEGTKIGFVTDYFRCVQSFV
jgi:hypothetical protein